MKELIEQTIEFLKGFLDFKTKDYESIDEVFRYSNSRNFLWISSKIKMLESILKLMEK